MGHRNDKFPIRIMGIIILVILMLFGAQQFRKPRDVEEAEIIFCGTKDDANSTILLSRGFCVLIDAGEEKDADAILTILKENNVKKIDCMILTHPDKDHVGGASVLLDSIQTNMVVHPYYGGEDKPVYDKLCEKMEDEKIPQLVLGNRRDMVYGDFDIQLYPPEKNYYKKSNNYSIVAVVQHGNNQILFTGDAEKERLKEIKRIPLDHVDLLAYPYHGRVTKSNMQYLEMISPKKVVITSKTIEVSLNKKMQDMQIEWYQTVPETQAFISDGKTIEHMDE